jgi:hypothetical protein
MPFNFIYEYLIVPINDMTSRNLIPVSSLTSLINVSSSDSPSSLCPCGKPHEPLLFFSIKNSGSLTGIGGLYRITAPIEVSRNILPLYFSTAANYNFYESFILDFNINKF